MQRHRLPELTMAARAAGHGPGTGLWFNFGHSPQRLALGLVEGGW
jgi:hypothetical protein